MTFYFLAAAIIVCAFLVIISKNPLAGALWLISTLLLQAAYFLTLNAHLVAALQVLLYAGAIMVLVIFVVMMIRTGKADLKWKTMSGERLILGIGAIYFAAVSLTALWIIRRGLSVTESTEISGGVEAVGKLLLTKYAVPFEVLSVLLLVAIVGAVVIDKKLVTKTPKQ